MPQIDSPRVTTTRMLIFLPGRWYIFQRIATGKTWQVFKCFWALIHAPSLEAGTNRIVWASHRFIGLSTHSMGGRQESVRRFHRLEPHKRAQVCFSLFQDLRVGLVYSGSLYDLCLRSNLWLYERISYFSPNALSKSYKWCDECLDDWLIVYSRECEYVCERRWMEFNFCVWFF